MTEVIIAIGSNINQKKNIELAGIYIKKLFDTEKIKFTRSVWTKPIGIKSDMFLNQLIALHTTCNYETVCNLLKEIERNLHSSSDLKRNGIVIIDMDILKFGSKIYHENDWNRDYIKILLSEIHSYTHKKVI